MGLAILFDIFLSDSSGSDAMVSDDMIILPGVDDPKVLEAIRKEYRKNKTYVNDEMIRIYSRERLGADKQAQAILTKGEGLLKIPPLKGESYYLTVGKVVKEKGYNPKLYLTNKRLLVVSSSQSSRRQVDVKNADPAYFKAEVGYRSVAEEKLHYVMYDNFYHFHYELENRVNKTSKVQRRIYNWLLYAGFFLGVIGLLMLLIGGLMVGITQYLVLGILMVLMGAGLMGLWYAYRPFRYISVPGEIYQNKVLILNIVHPVYGGKATITVELETHTQTMVEVGAWIKMFENVSEIMAKERICK